MASELSIGAPTGEKYYATIQPHAATAALLSRAYVWNDTNQSWSSGWGIVRDDFAVLMPESGSNGIYFGNLPLSDSDFTDGTYLITYWKMTDGANPDTDDTVAGTEILVVRAGVVFDHYGNAVGGVRSQKRVGPLRTVVFTNQDGKGLYGTMRGAMQVDEVAVCAFDFRNDLHGQLLSTCDTVVLDTDFSPSNGLTFSILGVRDTAAIVQVTATAVSTAPTAGDPYEVRVNVTYEDGSTREGDALIDVVAKE